MRRTGQTGRAAGALALAAVLALAGCTGGSDDERTPVAATASASTVVPTPEPSPAGSTFSLVATGDVLLHPALWEQARADGGGNDFEFGPMLESIQPYVADADLGLCHLETPLAPKNGPFLGYPSFSGPPQIATALADTGYDACSTASNHTLDQGSAGIGRTLGALDRAGIAHAGSARTAAEGNRITTVRKNGVKVALLSYAYGFNGRSLPADRAWEANPISRSRVLADAKRARRAGADLVVLSMHWGTEYSSTPSAQQLDLAPELARSGAFDVIVSHHAHVVEPLRRYGKTWVAYGLGNLVASHATRVAANQEGLLVRFDFRRGTDGRWTTTAARYLPLLVTRKAPIRLLAVPDALRDRDYGSSTRARLEQAEAWTQRVVDSLDADDQGLTELAPG